MSTSVSDPRAADLPPSGASRARTGAFPRWFRDPHGWIAAGLYLLAILYFDRAALEHMHTVCACSQTPDPTQWMWSWVWIPYAIGHGLNPFFTSYMWSPGPFNLAAVTLAPVIAIPGAPLDALFGPIFAFNVLLFSAPVISGWCAYRLCRYLSGAPWASMLAGYTYGFSSYELAHQLAHMNLVWTFAPPLLILITARLMQGEISRRRAAVQLSLVCLIQFGISTEIFFAMVIVLVAAIIVGWFVATPQWRPRIAQGVLVLAIAGVVTAVVWSYYIYESFQAPASSKGFPTIFPSDLLSYVFPNDLFRLGGPSKFAGLASTFNTSDVTEQNSYLGLPLILIFFAYGATLWRRQLTRAVVIVSFVAFVLSLGITLNIAGNQSISLPYHWLENLPLFNLLTPSRFALFVSLGAALAVALWLAAAGSGLSRIRRWTLALAALAFLYPNLGFTNLSFPYREQAFTQPAFFTTALYKRYLHRNEVVLPLPYSYATGGLSLLWQADAHMYFKMASGYFGTGVPGDYNDNPLSIELITGDLPANAPVLFNTLTRAHHVTAVLVQDNGVSQSFLTMLRHAHWTLRADAGGMQVYRFAGKS